jgi:hypothetical protein
MEEDVGRVAQEPLVGSRIVEDGIAELSHDGRRVWRESPGASEGALEEKGSFDSAESSLRELSAPLRRTDE